MDIHNATVLVTGGTGFIGTSFIKLLLLKGTKIICLTRRNIPSHHKNLIYVPCDLRHISSSIKNTVLFYTNTIDYIAYLAAGIPLLSDKRETMSEAKNNTLDPFIFFLELFGTVGKKIILTSTIDVYGTPIKPDFTEGTRTNPTTPYAIAKLCCEKYLEYYCRKNNKAYTIIRFSQTYGPGEPLVRIIPHVIQAAIYNKTFTLRGSGKDRRKFLYVDDAALAIYQALMDGENDVYNIAGNETINVKKIIKTVEIILIKKISYMQTDISMHPMHILPNTDKARKILHFQPRITFYEGMKRALTYDSTNKKS